MDQQQNNYGDFEVAFKQFGNPSLVREFDSFSRHLQHRLLEGLAASIREVTLQKMVDHGQTLSRNDNSSIDWGCPLIISLRNSGIKVQNILASDMEEIKRWLRAWGAPSPSPNIIAAQFEARVKSEAKSQRRNKQMGRKRIMTTNHNIIKSEDCKFPVASDWTKQLRVIGIRNLSYFHTCKDCMLEGSLLVDPFTPVIGTTTLLQDCYGDVILVALYNFLPEITSQCQDKIDVLAKLKLPKGSKVRIFEPYCKIFRDGSRGIRIDNPNEIQIIQIPSDKMQKNGKSSNKVHKQTLEKVKKEGNLYYLQRLYYVAAEIYVSSIQHHDNDFIPKLLSNRSLIFIQLKDWYNAILDAAASLTLRPSSKKTWQIYQMALEKIMEADVSCEDRNSQEQTSLLNYRTILGFIFSPSCNAFNNQAFYVSKKKELATDDDEEILKEKGDLAFSKQEFVQAKKMYTLALQQETGDITKKILNDWSKCSLSMDASFHDSVAASIASLRICPDYEKNEEAVYCLAKALAFLGEPKLSIQVMEIFGISKAQGPFLTLLQNTHDLLLLLETRTIADSKELYLNQPKILSDWLGSIETFQTKNKGRGVRAKKNIERGEVVLVERPIISCKHYAKTADKATLLSTDADNKFSDHTQTSIKSTLINRSKIDSLLCRIVDKLYDGEITQPLVSLNDLILHLASSPLLLPSHHAYRSDIKLSSLNPQRVARIISTNSHGSCRRKDHARGSYWDNLEESTELLPAHSMFNHSSNPSCFQLDVCSDCHILVASTNVKKGEELTVCYHPDEGTIRNHWGF